MRICRFLLVLGVLVILVAPLAAQQGTSEVKGRVMDPQGGVLPGVTVNIKNQDTGMFRQTVSDREGVYFISGVTPGTYEVNAELSGFNNFKRPNQRLEIGKTATIDIKMQVGSVGEEITVAASSPLIDVTSKEVGGNITSKELIELPSVNRNFIGFVGLLPGVIPSISTESFGSDSVSVNGQDSRNNNYLFDGGNNNDDVIGQRAGTQARTPLEAVQEFQVLTGQYDAEFGRTTGAIINAITKQGTNELSGVVFGFLQDASMTEESFFVKQNNLAKPETKFLQYGATLGGPILRDRLHFFASIERVENDRANDVIIAARPEFNASPTTQDRVWNTMIRVDSQVSASNSGALRWLRESSPQVNQIVPFSNTVLATTESSREEVDIDQTASANWNSVFGNSSLNTFRLTWTQEDVAFANPGFNGNGGNQAALPPTLRFATYQTQQSEVAQARVNNAYYIEDTFNWYANNHDARFGVQLGRLTQHFEDQGSMNGIFVFRGNATFDPNNFSTYPERLTIRVPGQNQVDMAAKYYGIFAQDKWSLRDNLTLSLGLRYDLEDLPITHNDNPLFSAGQDYPKDKNNISPRLGMTYNLGTIKTTVLRAGYGRFYDKTHFELIQGAISAGVFSSSFTANFPTNAADPGPANGQRPTNPFLSNGPVVDRTLLAQMFPPGTRIKNTGTVSLDHPDRVIPYADQISAGISHQLTPGIAVSLDYIHADAKDQFMTLEINPGLRADTRNTTPLQRTNPAFSASTQALVNTGSSKYDALEFQFDHHLGVSYQYRLSYTYSKSRGNTSGNGSPLSPFQVLGDMNLDENDGPTDFDRPHNVVFSGSWRVPHAGGLTLATVTRYLSGTAFSITNGQIDANRNGLAPDPLPSGRYDACTGKSNCTIPRNAISVFNEGGRNGARGPDFFQMDARVGYDLKVADVTLQVFGELFNVTNRANFANPSGDQSVSSFLQRTQLRAGAIPRTAQVGVRVKY